MPEWLFPLGLFFILISGYLGGTPVRIHGGSGARQLLGLTLTLVLYMAVWGVARTAAGAALDGATTPGILAVLLAALTLPATTWAGFRLVGVRVERLAAW